MAIGLSGSGGLPDEAAREMLEGGVPLALKFDEAINGPEPMIKGFLLVDALGTKAGTRVTVMQAQGFRGWRGIAEAIAGSDKVPPLSKGEVIAFSAAYVQKGIARVGQIAARAHDGLKGDVQVFTAMARASQSRVSKKGASQFLTVTDGKAATVARNYEDVEKAFAAASAKAWPGGAAGFLIRDRDGGTGEFFEEKDAGIDYLLEELRQVEALDNAGDALELVPAWRLPMGRDQLIKDVDPKQDTPRPVSGPFTRLFETGKQARLGFLPCLVVACDEEEWAFGGKTGRKVRVASAVQPLFKRTPVLPDRLPTAVRAYGGTPNTVLALYDDAVMKKMAAERAARRGPDPQGTNDDCSEEEAVTRAMAPARKPMLLSRAPGR